MLPRRHIFVPESMNKLSVSVDVPYDPWEDETVLTVFPNLPRGSNNCYKRFLYLREINNTAYVKCKSTGGCPHRPMSFC